MNTSHHLTLSLRRLFRVVFLTLSVTLITLSHSPVLLAQNETPGLMESAHPLGFDLSQSTGGDPTHIKVGLLGQSLVTEELSEGQEGMSARLMRVRSMIEMVRGERSSHRYSRLFIQTEWAASPQLLDAELELSWSPSLKLLMGRYRSLFLRSWRTGLGDLPTPGRGAVSDAFRPERATGLALFGTLGGEALEYALSAFDDGAPDGKAPRQPHYSARVSWNPLGATPYTQTPWTSQLSSLRVAVGLNAMLDVDERSPLTKITGHTEALDLTLLTPRLAWVSELYQRAERDPAKGAQTQLGALLTRLSPHEMIDASARVGVIKRPSLTPQVSAEATLGYLINLYHAKLSLHLLWARGGVQEGAEAPTELRASLFGQLFLW